MRSSSSSTGLRAWPGNASLRYVSITAQLTERPPAVSLLTVPHTQVRDSLQLLIRSLPEGVLFNIAGFGSRVEFLFKDGSVEYTPESFQRGTHACTRPTLCVAFLTLNYYSDQVCVGDEGKSGRHGRVEGAREGCPVPAQAWAAPPDPAPHRCALHSPHIRQFSSY